VIRNDFCTHREGIEPLSKRARIAVRILIALYVAGLIWLLASIVPGGDALGSSKCRSVAECRRAVDWQRSQRRRAERDRWRLARPTIVEASFAAAATYPGVDPWEMVRQARCETGLGKAADGRRAVRERNSATAEGPWQWLDSTWWQRRNPYRRFNRDNAWIEALATAWLVQRDHGWSEWSCQP
jgi:hypothetical protein